MAEVIAGVARSLFSLSRLRAAVLCFYSFRHIDLRRILGRLECFPGVSILVAVTVLHEFNKA